MFSSFYSFFPTCKKQKVVFIVPYYFNMTILSHFNFERISQISQISNYQTTVTSKKNTSEISFKNELK